MKNYTNDSPYFSESVQILETTDTNHADNFNVSTKQLFENTLVLKKQCSENTDKLDGIDEGANNYTHPDSGVTAGTYNSVTVDKQGHVTGASNTATVVISSTTPSNTNCLWVN